MGTKVEGNSKYAHSPLAAKAACALPASERCRAGSTASSSGVPWRRRTRARRSPIHARRTTTGPVETLTGVAQTRRRPPITDFRMNVKVCL